jgi:DNA-binding NtrC family response regulator
MLAPLKVWLSRRNRAGAGAGTGDAALQRAAYVIDDEAGICNFVVETLSALGVKSDSFHTAKEALATLDRDRPALIFLDVALLQSDAIDVVHGLNERRYGGIVHLMSGGNPSLVKAVERIGARKGLRFGPPLSKPVRREAIVELVEGMGIAKSPK